MGNLRQKYTEKEWEALRDRLRLRPKSKKYRFYYHWVRQTGKWSVHFKNQCTHRLHLTCKVDAETKIRKVQPYRVMQGFATQVKITEDRIIII